MKLDQFNEKMQAQINKQLARELSKPEVRKMAQGVESEMQLHKQIMAHCDAQWPKWKYIRARSDQRSTIAVGCQDFTIFMPRGQVLCVEVKRKDAKLSLDQRDWAHELMLLNRTVHVVRNFAEFIALL